MAQFAKRSQNATARDETDPSLSLRTGMDALLVELERVVQETLQPEGVKVWLRNEGVRRDSGF